MAHLGPIAIAKLMREVGFVQPHAPHGTTPGWDPNSYAGDATVTTGVAIVMAESGGDTLKVHKNYRSHSNVVDSEDLGLWQINSVAHADLLSKYDWKDAKQNTEMAKIIWQEAGGFSPWVTYNNNAYKKYEGKGQQGLNGAIKDYQKAQSPSVQLGNLNPFSEIMSLLPRAGLVALGAGILIVGIILMIESSKVARQITTMAVAPEASAAEAAESKGSSESESEKE